MEALLTSRVDFTELHSYPPAGHSCKIGSIPTTLVIAHVVLFWGGGELLEGHSCLMCPSQRGYGGTG